MTDPSAPTRVPAGFVGRRIRLEDGSAVTVLDGGHGLIHVRDDAGREWLIPAYGKYELIDGGGDTASPVEFKG